MKRAGLFLLMLAVTVSVASAQVTEKSSMKGGKPYFEATQKATAQATVLKVDKSKRIVTMKTEQGDTLDLECGQQVKNFGQIRVGDVVKVAYTEHLTVHVESEGSPGMSDEATMSTANPGEKPGAMVSAKTQIKATITAIDKAKGTVTLKGPEGNEAVVKPRKPENLDKVKVGDVVVFTYTESVAASVQKVAAK